MFKRILVAYDGSEGAKLALAKGVEIADGELITSGVGLGRGASQAKGAE